MTTSRKTARRAALAIASAILLSSCGSLLGPKEDPPKIYVLHPDFGPLPDAPAVRWQLTIGSPDTTDVLQTQRIALQHGQTLDYYAGSQWTDMTPDLIQGLMVESFEKTGKISAVAAVSNGIRGDFILTSEIRDFSAHYDSENGAPKIVVDIVVKLIGASHRDVVGTLDSHHEAQASANSVPAVVSAFKDATGAALEEIAGWALSTAPSTAPGSSGAASSMPAPTHHHPHG